jgi:hypothetical protein
MHFAAPPDGCQYGGSVAAVPDLIAPACGSSLKGMTDIPARR